MNGRTLTLGLVAGLAVAGLARKSSASLNLRGARNGEALRSDLLPAALRDTHDLVVTEIQKRTSHWEPTGVGNGVTSVPYRYHTLVAVLYPKGERQKESRLGQVAATSERKRETPIPLRGRCADDLVRLGGPAYAFGVTGAFVDEGLRGKGVGQALYAALVEAAGTHGGALASNRCLTGTELTSADALRVWERLGRRYAVEGEVAWHRKGSAARRGSGDRRPYKQSTETYYLNGVIHDDPVSAFNDVALPFFDSDYWDALGLDEDNDTTEDAHEIILDAWKSFGGRSDDRVFAWHEVFLHPDVRGKGFGRTTVARIEDMLARTA
jgi:GNAT superfamily N-acetyltransferase